MWRYTYSYSLFLQCCISNIYVLLIWLANLVHLLPLCNHQLVFVYLWLMSSFHLPWPIGFINWLGMLSTTCLYLLCPSITCQVIASLCVLINIFFSSSNSVTLCVSLLYFDVPFLSIVIINIFLYICIHYVIRNTILHWVTFSMSKQVRCMIFDS